MKRNGLVLLVITTVLASQTFVTGSFADSSTAWYPDPYALNTTLNSQVVPVPPPPAMVVTPPAPNDVAAYAGKGYGNWELAKANGYTIRTDILPSGIKTVTKSSQFTQFITMSDVHIVDIQSTTQPLYFGEKPSPGMQSAYSASMLYSTQTFNSAVKSVNELNKESKIDFGLFLGDAVNNAQQNELEMYLDVLTGRMVNPNSDPTRTFTTDYSLPFKGEGLDIPWYQVIGNHDHFWAGSQQNTEKVKASDVGDTVMKMGTKQDTQSTEGNVIYGGVIDPSTEYGTIVKSGIAVPGDEAAHKVAASIERKIMNNVDFVNMFPKGHGLKADTSADPLGCYTIDPVSDVPIRVIVLDNTAPQDEVFVDPTPENKVKTNAAMAFLSKAKLEWLKTHMAQAQSENKLIVVAIHIPTGMKGLWSSTSEVSEQEFIDALHSYANMSLLLAGHRHLNTVIPYPSPTSENGFWQVETASLRDFPQEFRMIRFNVNDNGTITMFANDVDPIMEQGSMMEKAREYAIAASQIFPEPPGLVMPAAKSRVENVALYKKLSPKMETVLKKYIK